MKELTLLITGVASGIGKATAEHFIKNGHTVYGIDTVRCSAGERFFPFVADITDGESLSAVLSHLETHDVRLDAIVNIAGVHMMASLAESNFAAMKRVIDINLCGTMLVNRTFHRLLNADGRVIIVTSEVASFDPMPFNGLYNVSKTALDSYAQALRQELNLIGQKVITIRPGAIDTPLSAESMRATRELAEYTKLYSCQAKNFAGIAAKFMGTPITPAALAAMIYKAGTSAHPRLIYSKHRNLGLVLLNILPKRLQCAVIKLLLGLNFQ